MSTNDSIGTRIQMMRKREHMSQDDLAKWLGVPRSAISQIENKERNVSSDELKRLAEIFKTTSDFLLGLENPPEIALERAEIVKSKLSQTPMRISVPAAKVDKFKQVLLYLLERCGGKPNVGETVVYKLLYFADFNFYEKYEEQLTGSTYRKLQFGPAPMEFQTIVEEMIGSRELEVLNTEYHGYSQKRYVPLTKADLNKLKASEKEILDQVVDQLSDRSATWISDYSHGDVPWKATADKDIIDYELVFYRTPPYSVRDYDEDDD